MTNMGIFGSGVEHDGGVLRIEPFLGANSGEIGEEAANPPIVVEDVERDRMPSTQ